MAHSKNDVPFFGGTLRQRTNTKKGIPTVECALIDPNTTCPYSLLYLDAQYIAGLCGANLPMLHAMFGMAWTEMDEESYLDLLSDEYAVARYLHLKRFSPYEPALLKRRVLMVQNSTRESQNFSISSHYAISARWRKKHDDKNH